MHEAKGKRAQRQHAAAGQRRQASAGRGTPLWQACICKVSYTVVDALLVLLQDKGLAPGSWQCSAASPPDPDQLALVHVPEAPADSGQQVVVV